VREGGVEPPRPCGHWNLNPARLPIPPPAHWVCLPAPCLAVRRLPTPRTLARGPGWIHIPSPRPGPHQHRHIARPRARPQTTRAAEPSATYQRVPVHVSTSYRYPASPQEPVRLHSRVRDTCLRPPLRSLAGLRPYGVSEESSKGSSQGNFDRRRHPSTPVDRADRGNQPIHRRVDTISKQYQVRQYPQRGMQDGSSYGGGAPWES
jgi:hypothetical protein